MKSSLLPLLIGILPMTASAQSLEIIETKIPDAPEQVPWVNVGDSAWNTQPPLFKINIEPEKASAEGWVAVSSDHFLLKVVVQDKHHTNTKTGTNIWDGDSIQIGLDALGDGARDMAKETTGPIAADDVALCLAFTTTGPEGYCLFRHPDAGATGPLPDGSFAVSRDDSQNLTTYTLQLPWSYMKLQPGLTSHIGLAVQLNDQAPDGKNQSRGYFGRGADGKPRPALHAPLILGLPQQPVAASIVGNTSFWSPDDAGEIHLALKSPTPLVINASLGTLTKTLEVAGDNRLRRFTVRGNPTSDSLKLSAKVNAPNLAEPILSQSAELVIPQDALNRFLARMDTLIEQKDNHPLFVIATSAQYVLWCSRNGRASGFTDLPTASSQKRHCSG